MNFKALISGGPTSSSKTSSDALPFLDALDSFEALASTFSSTTGASSGGASSSPSALASSSNASSSSSDSGVMNYVYSLVISKFDSNKSLTETLTFGFVSLSFSQNFLKALISYLANGSSINSISG